MEKVTSKKFKNICSCGIDIFIVYEIMSPLQLKNEHKSLSSAMEIPSANKNHPVRIFDNPDLTGLPHKELLLRMSSQLNSTSSPGNELLPVGSNRII